MKGTRNRKNRKPSKTKTNGASDFTIAFANIRGFRNLPEVHAHMVLYKPDIIAISESGSPESSDPSLAMPGYSKPELKADPLKRGCHGLMVYIKGGFPAGRVKRFEVDDAPFMCFRIALVQSTSYIFTLYRPQNDADGDVLMDQIAEKVDLILTECPSANIHICGDFNVHHKEWLIHSNTTDAPGRQCHDFAMAFGLTQIVDVPTRVPDRKGDFASLLDLFLTSVPDKCVHSVTSPLGSSDHCVVSVKVDTKYKKSSDAPFHRKVYRFAKADWDGFRSFMSDMPHSSIFSKDDVSENVEDISKWIQAGMDNFIPSKTYQQKPDSPPWFTPECAASVAHSNHHYHLYVKNPKEYRQQFVDARNEHTKVIRNAKNNYAESIKTKIGNEQLGSREFWRITNKVLGRGKSSVPTLINGPEVISSSIDKAELFAKNFASNSNLDDKGCALPNYSSKTDKSLSSFTVSAKEVAKLIKALDSTKATGPDNIPVIVLKNISPELSPILAKVFNKCLLQKCFPISWKISSVCPVYKNSGDRSSPSQYRPISLLSIMSKLLESVINKRVTKHLMKNHLLCDEQYGFRSSRSTADVLTVITHRVSEALDEGFMTRAVALDISKAFDKVWHRGLLLKLSRNGISGNVLGIIESFLSNRSLNVVINGQKSKAHNINAGVPQGSLLGPTLFLLFINDLPNHIIKSLVSVYADDTTLYSHTSKIHDEESLASDLSSDLENIQNWGKEWLVTFNASKTKLLSFHHHRNPPDLSSVKMSETTLSEASSFDRLLGLKITPDLKWNEYIGEVAKVAGKMVGSLFRSRRYLSPASILYLYKSQIRPKMEYCCHIWGGAAQTSLSCLDRVQRRLRYLVGDELFSTLPPLVHRRNVSSLSLFYRYHNAKCSEELHSLVPPKKEFARETRLAKKSHEHTLSEPTAQKKAHGQSFIPRTTTQWNALPSECFPEKYDLDAFKSNVNSYLLDSY